MQTNVHRATDRGYADHGWLKTHHTFSFAGYHRPDRMHFGMLRVLNDDLIAAGTGFGTHPHENMEIVSIPLRGALTHRDSMGHEETIATGEVQAMSAGTGITHSEFNASETEEAAFLQIWIIPRERGITPRYDQKAFLRGENSFRLLVSPDGREESLMIGQDAFFQRGWFAQGESITVGTRIEGNGLYLFVIDGSVAVCDSSVSFELLARDGMEVRDTDAVDLAFGEDSDLLCIEVPMR